MTNTESYRAELVRKGVPKEVADEIAERLSLAGDSNGDGHCAARTADM